MNGRLRFFDYRCFSRELPAELVIRDGFSAFVGPNNSGKSALLRSIQELRGPISGISQLRGAPHKLVDAGHNYTLPPPSTDPLEIIRSRDDAQCVVEVSVDPIPDDETLHVSLVRLRFRNTGNSYRTEILLSTGQQLTRDGPLSVQGTEKSGFRLHNGQVVDVDRIVGLVDVLSGAKYFGAFRNAINEGAGSYFDLQIGTGFINQWRLWKTGGTIAQAQAVQRVTEDIRRLIGSKTLEINDSADQKTLQVVVDGRPFKLHELGSGISQLIVVLGNALTQRPSLVIIDEPESHLHPALQQDFLTSLASYARNGVFFATHAIGLARAIADSCHSVMPSGKGTIVRPFEKTRNFAEFLGSLGIAGLQEIGWNKVLLVEGPTDVRTFQQLLRLHGKESQTVVLPLGGSSMVNGKVGEQLAEVRRLCGTVAAIVDSERAGPNDEPPKERREFAELCGQLGIPVCLTKLRATENYLTDASLQLCFGGNRYQALGQYEKGNAAAKPFWGKSDNWRVARFMTRSEIDNTDIGAFLARL